MQLTGEHLIPAAIAQVWASLNDMELIRRCIPGCESIEPLGEGRHAVAMVAAIGPVKARFRGTITLRDAVAPTGYTLVFEGSGGVAGFARGQAQVRLQAVGEQQTRLQHEVQADIGGKLAQVGSRLIDAASAKLSADFFQALQREMAAPSPATPSTAPAPSPALPAANGNTLHVAVSLHGGGWIAAALVAGAFAGALLATLLQR